MSVCMYVCMYVCMHAGANQLDAVPRQCSSVASQVTLRPAQELLLSHIYDAPHLPLKYYCWTSVL